MGSDVNVPEEGVELLAAALYDRQRTYSQPAWDDPDQGRGHPYLTENRRQMWRSRARHYLQIGTPAIRSQERERVRAALLSDEAIDEVADEFTEGDEGVHPDFVRSLADALFRTVPFELLDKSEADHA